MSEKEKEAIVEEQQQDISELLQIRRDKLAALQAEGNNPFFVNRKFMTVLKSWKEKMCALQVVL